MTGVQTCALPIFKHWLPTREYGIVSDYIRDGGHIPENLTVRLSAYIVDGPAPVGAAKRLGVQTSTVSTSNFDCPASKQGNKCLSCRACWDKSVPNVAYGKH